MALVHSSFNQTFKTSFLYILSWLNVLFYFIYFLSVISNSWMTTTAATKFPMLCNMQYVFSYTNFWNFQHFSVFGGVFWFPVIIWYVWKFRFIHYFILIFISRDFDFIRSMVQHSFWLRPWHFHAPLFVFRFNNVTGFLKKN